MSAPVILALMSFCFLFFGYLGVPVPFSLLAGVFVGAFLADVSLAAIVHVVATAGLHLDLHPKWMQAGEEEGEAAMRT